MTNLVAITVQTTDESDWDAIKAKAAAEGDEAAEAFNTAFKLKASVGGTESGAARDAEGLLGDDASMLSKLKSEIENPGGIGLLGTGDDTSLLSMLKNDLREASEDGGIPLLGEGAENIGHEAGAAAPDLASAVSQGAGEMSTEDFVKQLMEGAAPGNVATEDVIHPTVDDSDIQDLAQSDGSTYTEGFDAATADIGSGIAESVEDADVGAHGITDGTDYASGFGDSAGNIGDELGSDLENAGIGEQGKSDGGEYGTLFSDGAASTVGNGLGDAVGAALARADGIAGQQGAKIGATLADGISGALAEELGDVFASVADSAKQAGPSIGAVLGEGIAGGVGETLNLGDMLHGAEDAAKDAGETIGSDVAEGAAAALAEGGAGMAAALSSDLEAALDKAGEDFAVLMAEMNDLRMPDILASMPDLDDFDRQLSALGQDLSSLAGPAGISAEALADVEMRIEAAGRALDEFEQQMPQALADLAQFGAAAGTMSVKLNPDMYAGVASGLFGGVEDDAETAGEDAGDGLIQGLVSSLAQGSMKLSQGVTKMIPVIGDTLAEGLADQPELAVGLAGAIVSAGPFIGAAISGVLTASLGMGLAAMAIYGASHSQQVVDAFHDLSTDASADLGKIGTAFVPVVTSILKTANGMLSTLTPVFANAASIISGPFEGYFDTLIESFESPQVATSIDAVAKAFGEILTSLTPELPQMINQLAGGITSMADAIGRNPQLYTDFINFLVDAVSDGMHFLGWLTEVAGAMAAVFGPVWDAAADVINTVIELVKALGDLFSGNFVGSLNALGGIWTKVWGQMSSGAQAALKDVADSMAKFFSGNFTSNMGSLSSAGAALIDGLVSGAESAFGSFTGWLGSIPGQIEADAEGYANLLTTAGSDLIGGLLDGITEGWDAVTGWLGSAGGTISGYFGSASNWLLQAGMSLLSGFASGVSSGWDSALSFLEGIPGDVVHIFADAGSWLISAGGDIIHGLLQGVEGAWDNVVSWFESIPSDILSALGIHSPPAWSISAGTDIGTGVGIGLAAMKSSLVAIASGVGDAMSGAMDGASGPSWAASAAEGITGSGAYGSGAGAGDGGGSGGGASAVHVSIELGPSFQKQLGLTPDQLRDIRHTVRVTGGGSAQKAFGH